jgi:AcrR family transcriptional regulator
MPASDAAPARLEGRQALKSRRTREKILNSAISLIKEGGFSAASASRIAERAGITWGAAQHHFGSKEDILEAVLQVSHERFIQRLDDPALRRGSLADRASAFVDRMWDHYQDDVYLAALEILLASRTGGPRTMRGAQMDAQGREHVQTLREIFHDCPLSDGRLQEALIFTHCALTGLTIEKLLETELHSDERYIRKTKLMLLMMLSDI